ncbi:hypothetical protein ACFY36_02530 [Actinoplanes sp. NPDC000266]
MESLTWDGITRAESLGEGAARRRHDLADRARAYDWPGVFALLAEFSAEALVNTWRPGGRSWFAPLHQAAHGGAPVEVAERLAGLGGWRLLRTADGEVAADIARRRGHGHLASALEPRPVFDIGGDELTAIQNGFHEVIRGRAADLVDREGLRLPEIGVLLESVPGTTCWFSVPGMTGGFAYHLEQRDGAWALVTESWSRVVGGSGQRHEVTAGGSRLVDEGFV